MVVVVVVGSYGACSGCVDVTEQRSVGKVVYKDTRCEWRAIDVENGRDGALRGPMIAQDY